MPFPAFDSQTPITWRPTRRTHLLHAAIALFLACIWPILGGTETLSVLAVNIAAAATVPLTSRYLAIGATISLILTVLAPVPFLGALAALSGWWALRRLRGSYATGHAQAWLGVIVGSATTVGWLWMWWITSYTA